MTVLFARAMPSARRRRSFLMRVASSTDGTRTRFGYTRSAQVPEPLAAGATRDRDLAAHHQALEHLRHVAAVRPAARLPRHDARVRDVARSSGPEAPSRSRTSRRNESLSRRARRASAPTAATRQRRRGRARRRPSAGRARCARTASARRAPAGAARAGTTSRGASRRRGRRRRDRRRRVDLEQRQVRDDLDEIGRALRVEQLRANRDAARLFTAELEHGHDARLSTQETRPPF